ncbi:hypothetical protein [Actinokineospora cianjurensis]|uniref:Uncharacterized protein n=1 Tax=Actinokineospora cianjurensis TaxID=585224 RepID=A0A421B1I5_9PSEU|nr:hypothetical protein [Actinokineospora cianjurensis]RLK58146.1 hypothetical protein CLV68_4240 [Actinokineospora cianjurensis]
MILTALVTAAPAQAYPSGCTWGAMDARGSYAVCTTGSGAYRSYTRCTTWYGGGYMRYGNWEVTTYPKWSISSCSWGDTRAAYGIETA